MVGALCLRLDQTCNYESLSISGKEVPLLGTDTRPGMGEEGCVHHLFLPFLMLEAACFGAKSNLCLTKICISRVEFSQKFCQEIKHRDGPKNQY